MNFIEGDILKVVPKPGTTLLICHQVNCLGVMGAGLARQIAWEWPFVEAEYKAWIQTCDHNRWPVLGSCQVLNTSGQEWDATDSVHVANLFGQESVSRSQRVTDYGALAVSLANMRTLLRQSVREWDIRFPYKMGCGLAGGDWGVIAELLDAFYPEATLVKLPF